MAQTKQVALRFPPEVKGWLEEQSQLNGSSQNSEVIRAIRERMRRVAEATELST